MTTRRTSTLEERMAQLEALIQSMPANIFHAQQQQQQAAVASSHLQDAPMSATSESNPSNSFPTIAPFPSMGVPPPGLSTAKLTNPATHFVPPRPASATGSITAGMNNVSLSP